MKTYRLVGADGRGVDSVSPGSLGGRKGTGGPGFKGVYGRLDCPTALRALGRGDDFKQHRVFFADEATAIAAGYRPCGNCLRAEYARWKADQSS